MTSDEIQYVRAHDGLHIAYQVRGEGPIDILELGGFGALFPLDTADEQPRWRRFEERLRSIARVIKFDLRGIGYSDQFSETPTVADWVADAVAVLDAAGSDSVHVLSSSFGTFAAIELAATHPDRVASLVLANGAARFASADDYPIGITIERAEELSKGVEPSAQSDDDTNDIDIMAPSLAADADVRRWWTRTARRGAGPATARAMWDIATVGDVRHHLPALDLPCLVLVSADNRFIRPVFSRWLADRIDNADLCEIPSADQVIWAMPDDLAINEIEQFLTGTISTGGGRRSIMAVLFTDIVESTSHNASKGDRAWLELLARHDDLAGNEIHRRGGRLIKRLGDGVLAVFPLASDAIDAALAVTSGATELDIGVRAGVHAAEVEHVDDDVLGLGVTIAARVLGEADGGEVLATRAVSDVLAGAAFAFESRGSFTLKGIEGEWELVAATRP